MTELTSIDELVILEYGVPAACSSASVCSRALAVVASPADGPRTRCQPRPSISNLRTGDHGCCSSSAAPRQCSIRRSTGATVSTHQNRTGRIISWPPPEDHAEPRGRLMRTPFLYRPSRPVVRGLDKIRLNEQICFGGATTAAGSVLERRAQGAPEAAASSTCSAGARRSGRLPRGQACRCPDGIVCDHLEFATGVQAVLQNRTSQGAQHWQAASPRAAGRASADPSALQECAITSAVRAFGLSALFSATSSHAAPVLHGMHDAR